jgi:hypothetical protein
MIVLAIYVAISVTFSAGFVAGAWWASRARFDEDSRIEVETVGWSHDHAGALVLGRRPSVAFSNRSYQSELPRRAGRAD